MIFKLNQKRKIVTPSSFEASTCSSLYDSSALTAMLQTAIAKLWESVMLMQRA